MEWNYRRSLASAFVRYGCYQSPDPTQFFFPQLAGRNRRRISKKMASSGPTGESPLLKKIL